MPRGRPVKNRVLTIARLLGHLPMWYLPQFKPYSDYIHPTEGAWLALDALPGERLRAE